jgi:hypothetical protein
MRITPPTDAEVADVNKVVERLGLQCDGVFGHYAVLFEA